MRNVRVFYKKIDRARYLSHLDLMRSMMRTVKMSRIEVKYTEGFNRRMYMTFALPLSLGYEGLRETMDFVLLDDNISLSEVNKLLRKTMPESLEIIEVKEAIKDASNITYADFSIKYNVVSKDIKNHLEIWNTLINQEEIIVFKKTKKKIKNINIKNDIIDFHVTGTDNTINIDMRVTAGIQKNTNPRLFVQAFEKITAEEINPNYTRIRLLDENGNLFE